MEPGQRSFIDLFDAITRHGKSLVKAEIEMFSAELAENSSGMLLAVILAAAAGLVAFCALIFILIGAMYVMVNYGFHAYAAAFIVAGFCLALCLVLAIIARSRMSGVSLVPHRTIAQIQLDAAMLERSLRNG